MVIKNLKKPAQECLLNTHILRTYPEARFRDHEYSILLKLWTVQNKYKRGMTEDSLSMLDDARNDI